MDRPRIHFQLALIVELSEPQRPLTPFPRRARTHIPVCLITWLPPCLPARLVKQMLAVSPPTHLMPYQAISPTKLLRLYSRKRFRVNVKPSFRKLLHAYYHTANDKTVCNKVHFNQSKRLSKRRQFLLLSSRIISPATW